MKINGKTVSEFIPKLYDVERVMNCLEGVLCLKVTGDHYDMNIDRANIMLASFAHFWMGPQPFRVIVVAASGEVGEISRRLLSWPNIILDIIDEESVIPGISEIIARGWYKQQLLKLVVSKKVTCKFYLTLDPDLIACKPISESVLVSDDRALAGWEPKECHPHWWVGAAKILQLEEAEGPSVFGVTPNILVCDISKAVTARLEMLYGADWVKYMLSAEVLGGLSVWTEYSIYYTFAQKNNLIHQCYQDQGSHEDLRLIGSDNIWFSGQIETWNPDKSFSQSGRGLFLVCQSNSFVGCNQIMNSISKHFPDKIVTRLLNSFN